MRAEDLEFDRIGREVIEPGLCQGEADMLERESLGWRQRSSRRTVPRPEDVRDIGWVELPLTRGNERPHQ